MELTVHYRAWELFRAAVGRHLPDTLRDLMPAAMDVAGAGTEVLALGGPTPMDRWAPDIVRWRAEGVTWAEIVRRTGLDLNRAYVAWKRHTGAD